MKKERTMKNRLIMQYPSTWHQDMWREGAPFGNGIIGGLVYGGIYKEIILINHAFLWRGGKNSELPDVSGVLGKIREQLDEKKIEGADAILTKELRRQGYEGEFIIPNPVADLYIETPSDRLFSHYRREVDMEKPW